MMKVKTFEAQAASKQLEWVLLGHQAHNSPQVEAYQQQRPIDDGRERKSLPINLVLVASGLEALKYWTSRLSRRYPAKEEAADCVPKEETNQYKQWEACREYATCSEASRARRRRREVLYLENRQNPRKIGVAHPRP